MSVRRMLSGSEGHAAKETAETKKPSGSGTSVSGYMVSTKPFRCNQCEYFTGKNLCTNKKVAKDKQVKTDAKSGLKIIDPIHGCCSYYEPNDEED